MNRPQNNHKFVNRMPRDPQVKPLKTWLPANRGFYARFRDWLVETGYSPFR